MTRIRKVETLNPVWVYELYTVSVETMFMDSKRSCWVCGGAFVIGDGMTVVGSYGRSNTLMHSRCYTEQTGEAPECYPSPLVDSKNVRDDLG